MRASERERDLYEILCLHLANPSPPKIVETEASHTHTHIHMKSVKESSQPNNLNC
jgi:hypothetical protein